MPPTRIKICGLKSPADALVAAHAGASAIGLVFAQASPRYVTIEQAIAVTSVLPAFVEPVGLFVDHDNKIIRATASALALRTVQLHGNESFDQAAALAPLRIVKAIAFRSVAQVQKDIAQWSRLPNLAALLFDAPPPATAEPGMTGGTGTALDWNALALLLKGMQTSVPLPPIVLAGGLNPANVRRAIDIVAPYAVDVSSGVESSRGVKSPQLIRDFCAAAF